MITHYDLFAGIGGFSLALEEVFTDEPIKHIFCEWEPFPTAVLRKHWPDGDFYGDIAELVTHTDQLRSLGDRPQIDATDGQFNAQPESAFSIVTGGFPCQPFSHAGRRGGTADDRYQWPNMFAVIRNIKPAWVIAENVGGLATWNDGLVLETVCADLESEGYDVQPFIIPASAVGAIHRRDRIWFIAHAVNPGLQRSIEQKGPRHDGQSNRNRKNEAPDRTDITKDTIGIGRRGRRDGDTSRNERPIQATGSSGIKYPDWSQDWREVALATCHAGMDDGLSRIVDGVPYSFTKWREASIKAYGNAIVPQVAMEVFKAIKLAIESKPA